MKIEFGLIFVVFVLFCEALEVETKGYSTIARCSTSLYGFGYNGQGGLGTGDTLSHYKPVQIQPPVTYEHLKLEDAFIGPLNLFVLYVDTSDIQYLASTGYNGFGNLANGDSGNYPDSLDFQTTLSMVEKSDTTGRKWKEIQSSVTFSIGITSDSILYSWGRGKGMGASVRPNKITDDTWIKYRVCLDHAIAIKSDSTLWVWGYNRYGQLGLGDTYSRSTPTQLNDEKWVDLACTERQSYGLKTDGSLWGWGSYLNLGATVSDQKQMTPVQIGSNVYIAIFASINSDRKFALDRDRYLWTWGSNNSGYLGLGDTNSHRKPTKMDTHQWQEIYPGRKHAIGLDIKGHFYGWGQASNGELGDKFEDNTNGVWHNNVVVPQSLSTLDSIANQGCPTAELPTPIKIFRKRRKPIEKFYLQYDLQGRRFKNLISNE